jgi:hypothetical protein
MLFGRQWPLTPEALKKGESAFITGHDVPRLPECMAAETPYERQHPPEVDHVVRAWKLLESLSRIDAGFLQRLLLIALQTPPLSLNTALPEALILVPAILKGQPTNPSDEALQLAHQLADLARQDPKFLDHYLAGLPRADFL